MVDVSGGGCDQAGVGEQLLLALTEDVRLEAAQVAEVERVRFEARLCAEEPFDGLAVHQPTTHRHLDQLFGCGAGCGEGGESVESGPDDVAFERLVLALQGAHLTPERLGTRA